MVNPYSQWLFLITGESDPSIFLPVVDDGENVSFMYNTTGENGRPNTTSALARQDISCYTSVLLDVYIQALHQVLRAEETRYFQTTEDDWSRTKPSAGDRSNEVYKTLNVEKQSHKTLH